MTPTPEPVGTTAPELRRLRKELARRRREPIRIIIALDHARPVRTLTIPRYLPAVVVAGTAALVVAAAGLSLNAWSLSSTVAGLKRRVLAMVEVADSMALRPQAAEASPLDPTAGAHLRRPRGAQGRFLIEAANGGEQVEVVLDLGSGDLEASNYRAVRRLMRCRRTGAETPIDPRLIEVLYGLAQRTGQKIVLISGYRAPGFATPGSYHLRGMAADIRIPGLTALMVRDLARALGVHGVGYYSRSQFVHVDVRDEPYYWNDIGGGEGGADPELEDDSSESSGPGRSNP